jgi:hypothetical protein
MLAFNAKVGELFDRLGQRRRAKVGAHSIELCLFGLRMRFPGSIGSSAMPSFGTRSARCLADELVL